MSVVYELSTISILNIVSISPFSNSQFMCESAYHPYNKQSTAEIYDEQDEHKKL